MMMEQIEQKAGFSIIIPVYNGAKTLPDTLRSINNLEGGPYELLVVDDASTDKTVEIARQAGARVISLPENRGPATARNRGGEAAQFPYLLFTDSDVLVPKGLLPVLQEQITQSKADAVQGTFSSVCPYSNYCSQYKNLYNRYVINLLPDWIDTTFTSITSVTKEAFLKCGGFDERIRTASIEDRTLGRHLTLSGFRIRLDRSLEVIHNKKLTFWGFIRNQYTRSRDLAKFMLRNRVEKRLEPKPQQQIVQQQINGENTVRFGTNSLSTMLRIPLIYVLILLCFVAWQIPIFWSLVIFFGVVYLHLISGFELYLVRQRGFTFALKGIPLNMIDAFVSGLGIAAGIVGFFMGKRY